MFVSFGVDANISLSDFSSALLIFFISIPKLTQQVVLFKEKLNMNTCLWLYEVWVQFYKMNLKKESNHLKVSLSLFSIIQNLIQICWDVKHVLPLALNASPYFFRNKHSCNAVRWAPALKNTSSCLCNTLVMCCQLSGQGTEPHPPVSEQMEKLSAKVWQSMEIPDKVQKYKRVCQNNGRCSGGEEGGGGGGSGCEKVASRERQSKRKEPE